MTMRSFCSALILVTCLALVGGCSYSYRTVLKGPARAARPQGCHINYEQIDPDKAAAVYQQIGLISVDGMGAEDELDEGLKEMLNARACKMGGEILVPMDNSLGVEESTTSFLVLIGKVNRDE